jgi:ArsR family transcriptional regulator
VAELVAVAGLGWSTVSRHLSVLKAAGIVAERRAGVQVYYRLELKSVGNFIRYLKDVGFRRRVEQFLQNEGIQDEV